MNVERRHRAATASTADALMEALERARAATGLSKAELARRSHVPAETVRRLLTGRGPNPTLATLLDMLKPMGLGLQLVKQASPGEEASADPEAVHAWLAHYGAPLYGAGRLASKISESQAPRPEYVLAEALGLARSDASVARSLPVALFRARDGLDMAELRRLAVERGEGRTLGFFLELTADLSGDAALRQAARPLRHNRKRERASQFFKVRSQLERKLAELKTPAVARRWGFRMNMSRDSFESMFRKALAGGE